MDELKTFISVLLYICGALSIGGAAAAVIAKAARPSFAYRKRVDLIERHSKENHEEIRTLRELNLLTCRGLMTLMDNAVTGNSIDKIKSAKQDMQEYLLSVIGN